MSGSLPPGFTLDDAPSALPPGFTLDATPPGPEQMTGWQREVALPASNIAKGAVSLAGIPGDLLRAAGYVGGKQAESQLAGNPFPPGVAGTPPAAWPTSAGDVLPQGNQVMEGRAPVTPPSGHNPFDTESLLQQTQKLGLTDRPDLTPQDARERYEAAAAAGVGAAAPAILAGGASLPGMAKALLQAGAGGAGGELGGTVGGAVGGPPGRAVGTLGGALLGGVLSPGGGGLGRVVPNGMDAETAALADAAAGHGIGISTGQASSNPFVKYADSWARRMPFSGYGSFDTNQQTAFNRALSGTFGEDAPKITPDVIQNAYSRIGGTMNAIAGRTNAPLDNTLQTDLANTLRLARTAGLQPGQTEAIERQIQNISDVANQNNGFIPGHVYQNLTKRGEALDLLQGSRSTTSGQLGGQIRDALDSALTRGATPEDVAALTQARTQYKALKTVEPLTMRADAVGGVSPSTGDISPAGLLSRVNQQYPTAARQGVGQIPLKDLAQIGQRFLKEPPSSGTAERLTIGGLGEAAATLGAPFFSEHVGIHPATAAATLGGTFAVPRIVGSVLRSPVSPPLSPLGNALMGAYPQLTNGSAPQ